MIKSPEAFGRLFKLMHNNGRFLMVPNRVTRGRAIFCDSANDASCYAGTDAFRIVNQMRLDGYPMVVTNYLGDRVLTPLLQSHLTSLVAT